MAEDINSSASFGQNNGDGEELPIIVAQRFLNIFRQLHIFSQEKREAFDKMLLELSPDIKAFFQTLPGGTPLQEYMEDLDRKSKGLEPLSHHTVKKNKNILQDALNEENAESSHGNGGGGIINGDNFARILASSLAESNAEIIKELQTNRPCSTSVGTVSDGQMKLIADESFTNIISQALSQAIENVEKKRFEDNKMISQSFLDLQENLTKLISQSTPVKFVSDDGETESVITPLQIKGMVDEMVKAQADYLQETTKNQKEQLSTLISTAIKESQQLSTQALIESFKKINEENGGPAPITYSANTPQGGVSNGSVEQALRAQGKEFSSIISNALKESQKTSAKTIVETLETMKKKDNSEQNNQGAFKIEEIMRMQANLFRDIARAQNQEFSALISNALKESQRQSTQAIINALGQLQNSGVQLGTPVAPRPIDITPQEEYSTAQTVAPAEAPTEILSESSVEPETPLIDKYASEDLLNLLDEDQQKKKKKKKKKKAKDSETLETHEMPKKEAVAVKTQEKKEEKASAKVKTEEKPKAEKEESKSKISETLLRLANVSSAFSSAKDIQDTDEQKAMSWGFGDSTDTEEKTSEDDQDWEWEYEEVPEDEALQGEEGQDWEWEYEDSDGTPVQGEEGQDWEWEYEDSDDNNQSVAYGFDGSSEDVIRNSEIIAGNTPHFVLLGLEDSNFKDPYIENFINVG